MHKWLFVLKYLFREILLINLLFTAIGVQLLLIFGSLSYIYLFWLKLTTLMGSIAAYSWYRKKHLYFFYNLGSGKKELLLSTALTDFSMSFLIFYLINVFFN